MINPNPIPKTINPTVNAPFLLSSPDSIVAVNGIRSPALKKKNPRSRQLCCLLGLHQWQRGLRAIALLWALMASALAQGVGAQSGAAQRINTFEPTLEVSIREFEARIRALAQDLPGAAAVLVIKGNVRPLMLFGFQSMTDIRPITQETSSSWPVCRSLLQRLRLHSPSMMGICNGAGPL